MGPARRTAQSPNTRTATTATLRARTRSKPVRAPCDSRVNGIAAVLANASFIAKDPAVVSLRMHRAEPRDRRPGRLSLRGCGPARAIPPACQQIDDSQEAARQRSLAADNQEQHGSDHQAERARRMQVAESRHGPV